MAKYRKKPVVIEAFMLGYDVEPQWFQDAVKSGVVEYEWRASDPEKFPPDGVAIKTLEGVMRANWYEYIIKGVKGEIYPCKHDIFEATYEPVTE